MNDRLGILSRRFRETYLSFEVLSAQLDAWAAAFPEFVALETIGASGDGRPLRILVIGRDPGRTRPAVWIDGNIHAGELCGSSVALAIAEDMIRFHLDPSADLHALPPHVKEVLGDVLFYVHPRLSPDGAEKMLAEAGYTRSTPRFSRPTKRARWVSHDVDGDERTLMMRVKDPSGDFVEGAASSDGLPGFMRPRTLEDPGPYYSLYPEGSIEGWDGVTIPDPSYLADNDVDLNRNFPFSWTPEPDQYGAAAFGASEPEVRAVCDFASRHPEIFAWLNLHTFGGVFIRPLGAAADSKMAPGDLALFQQIGAWGEELTGYPMVSGFEEFTYEPDKPLHGDEVDFAYHVRGAIAYVCELWDLFRELGLPKRKPFVDHYSRLDGADLRRLYEWDRTHNAGRIFVPWNKAEHPQLGAVEVGGMQPLVGIQNPPFERIAEICQRQAAMFLRVAALAPRVSSDVRVEAIGPASSRLATITLTLANTGYLPTYVLESAKSLGHGAPIVVRASASGDLAIDGPASVEVGHLEGWGHGLYATSLFAMASRHCTRKREVVFRVRGTGTLSISVFGVRIGDRRLDVPVP